VQPGWSLFSLLFLGLVLFPILPHSTPSTTPAVLISQDQPSPVKYVHTFSLQNSPTDPFPFVLYPSSNKTVWIVSIKFGTPNLAQIINFTLGPTPERHIVYSITNALPDSIIYDQSRQRVWFNLNDTVAYYDLSAKTERAGAKFPDNPSFLALDSSHRLWITLVNSNKVVMFDPTTNQTVPYPVPTRNAILQGITVAPDGTIWFAEALARKLGHIACDSCSVQEFSPPSSLKLIAPIQVAVEPNGIVWFTDHGSNQFGSFNPTTLEWKTFPVGFCHGECHVTLPNAVSVVNGQVWFSEHFAGRIARYDPSTGLLVEYIIPIPSGDLSAYAWWAQPGPGNLVWFTAFGLGEIGYVNASIPVPATMSAGSSIVLPQGGSANVPVSIDASGIGSLTLAVSPFLHDSDFLNGTSTPEIVPSNGQASSATVTIRAVWNTPPGPRYVTLTGLNGLLAVSVQVKVDVTQSQIPLVTIGTVAAISLGGALAYARRPRRLKSETVEGTRQ